MTLYFSRTAECSAQRQHHREWLLGQSLASGNLEEALILRSLTWDSRKIAFSSWPAWKTLGFAQHRSMRELCGQFAITASESFSAVAHSLILLLWQEVGRDSSSPLTTPGIWQYRHTKRHLDKGFLFLC